MSMFFGVSRSFFLELLLLLLCRRADRDKKKQAFVY
jgi:hypothetical protein